MTTAAAMQVFVQGIGLLGPGLPSWPASRDVLLGAAPHAFALSVLPAPPRLPPAERRRAGPVIRLAMAVAEEAVAHADADPSTLPTVFASSGGEGANCHSLCETLASPDPLISPTRFTNSVHNAAAGYWHIAVGSRAASTSLCAFDGSFGAGLVEAATLLQTSPEPLLLVAYDLPYPEPLNSVRPLVDNFGLALLLTPAATPRSIAALRVGLRDTASAGALTACADASLDALRRNLPAAAALPLLQALAHAEAAAAPGGHAAREPTPTTALTIAYLPHLRLCVEVVAAADAGAEATVREEGPPA